MNIGYALGVLGGNMAPPLQMVRRFGVRYATDGPWDFPWGAEALRSPCPFVPGKTVAETHYAFPGLVDWRGEPLTIMQMHCVFPPGGTPTFLVPDGHPYAHQVFANRTVCASRWYLFFCGLVPGSTMKNWDEQRAMIPDGYEVPAAVEATLFHLAYHDTFGTYLAPGYFGRCRDMVGEGENTATAVVGVPHHGSQLVSSKTGAVTSIPRAITIETWRAARRFPDLGIYASRRLP